MRVATGEATVDARGLAIRDDQQGWSLRVGEVSSEMLTDAARDLDATAESYDSGERRFYEDLATTGPVFGLHWSLRF